jgi:hypothetical protein
MGTDQAAVAMTGHGGRPRIAPSLALVACLLAIPSAAGCRPRTPEIGFANRRYSAALRTAANTKSRERLERAKDLIDRDHAAGTIGSEEYACYRAIIELAEAGRWEAAERQALEVRRDQQR